MNTDPSEFGALLAKNVMAYANADNKMTNPYTGKPLLAIDHAITNDGFFPDLAMADLMAIYRIPSEYADATIKDGLMMAMIEISRQLLPVKAFLSVNYANLAAYSVAHSEQIGGVEVVTAKYQEAVFSYAKALLLQQFKTINRKAEAENQAKESPETENYWLSKSMNAVYFLFDKFKLDYSTGKYNANLPFVALI